MIISKNKISILIISLIVSTITSCVTSDSYQKQYATKEGNWSIKDSKIFNIKIDDTTKPYDLYLLVRNDDAYPFENLWVKIKMTSAADSTIRDSSLVNCKLANTDGNWLGNKQGSLYDHKIKINAALVHKIGKRVGDYKFEVTQMMRQNPLNGIHNVGIILDKRNK